MQIYDMHRCKRKMKKRIIFGIVFLILLVGGLLLGKYIISKDKTAETELIKKLDEGIYFIEYTEDYGFDTFLEEGGAASEEEMGKYLSEFLSDGKDDVQPKTEKQGCSTIQGKNKNDEYLFGRNFDWKDCTIMIVKTKPENGYASISTCNVDFLGLGEEYLKETSKNKILGLSAIYVPLDGMNEKGLCVADLLILTDENTNQETGKSNLTTTTAIRLLLDKAANVEEAIALLEQYDMHSSIGMMHHLAIADAEGNSVVVEYIDNELKVTQTPVVTNFYLTEGEKYGIGIMGSDQRYDVLMEYCESGKNSSELEIKNALQSVSQNQGNITVWSIIYNQHTKNADYYFKGNYENVYHFDLD